MLGWYLLAPALLGHFCLSVWPVNVVHGMGLHERWMRSIKVAALSWLVAGWAALVWLVAADSAPIVATILNAYATVCLGIALIGLPAVTVARLLRRTPEGIRGRSTVVDLTAGHEPGAFIGHGADTFWLRLPGNQAFQLELSEYEVVAPGLPETWDGLTILHTTDLHLAPAYDRRFFEAVFDQIDGHEPDLVLFTGDLIDSEATLPWAIPLFSRLRGRLGQYAILGNHDHRYDLRGPTNALESAGFRVLDGEWARVIDAAGTLALGGTCHPWGPWMSGPAPADADFQLLMCHSPDGIYRAARQGVNLVLSGHTHGGQYRLPLIGPVLMPSRYSRRLDMGFFQVDQTLLFVSRGIGAQHPLRVNCRPEVTRLVLRSPRPHLESFHSHGSRGLRQPSAG